MSYYYHSPKCNLAPIKIEIARSDWVENIVTCEMRIKIAAGSGPKLKWALGPLVEADSVVVTDQRRGGQFLYESLWLDPTMSSNALLSATTIYNGDSTMKFASGTRQDLSKASLGSIEYISSLYKSTDRSRKIKEAVEGSSYRNDFVQAALSVNEKVTLFHFEDEAREGSKEVISILKDKANLHVLMLTGDHELSALRIAKIVGISEVHHCLKPEDKLNRVKTTAREKGMQQFYFSYSMSCISMCK
ncbi:hypothetical protein ZIOFF_029908 [Zingiber officinale]|uniref:Uncharacterized protein n=1 Tax=Zingiber officinale TaxID=94328 RepID=A0A8J5H8P7_ZINOF|nr:hypothetical protein ZIOFF_029908 [Zingiber officinale]